MIHTKVNILYKLSEFASNLEQKLPLFLKLT